MLDVLKAYPEFPSGYMQNTEKSVWGGIFLLLSMLTRSLGSERWREGGGTESCHQLWRFSLAGRGSCEEHRR